MDHCSAEGFGCSEKVQHFDRSHSFENRKGQLALLNVSVNHRNTISHLKYHLAFHMMRCDLRCIEKKEFGVPRDTGFAARNAIP